MPAAKTRHIAFLRAINVGGRTVRMADLVRIFSALGFSGVETFIASGNVIFETKPGDRAALERRIERALREALGYDVATFVRTTDELAAIASYAPFRPAQLSAAPTLNVAFLAGGLGRSTAAKLEALSTDIDEFHVHGRELYWLCMKKQSESKFSNVVFERAIGVKATFRGINTVRKMAAKYCVELAR